MNGTASVVRGAVLSIVGVMEGATAPAGPAFEKHYSVKEIAELWGIGEDKTREIFKDEDGVVVIGTPERRYKRGYLTLRVPESVVRRVHQKMTRRAA